MYHLTKASEELLAALYGKITSPDITATLNKELKALGTNLGEATEGAKKQLRNRQQGYSRGRGDTRGQDKGIVRQVASYNAPDFPPIFNPLFSACIHRDRWYKLTIL